MTFGSPRTEAASRPGLMIQPSRDRPALKPRALPAIIPPSTSVQRRTCLPLGCMIDLERRWRAVITITKITIVREPMLQRRLGARQVALDRAGRRSCAADAQFVCSGGNVLTADSVGSGGETRHQHYNELGAGKLDSVYFQSIPTDEAKRAGYFLWRLDAALATLE